MALTEEQQKVQELIAVYEKAEKNLISLIAEKEAKGNVTTYQKEMLESIRQELKILNDYVQENMEDIIRNSYQQGIDETYEQFRQENIDISRSAGNSEIINNLVDNTTGNMVDANNFVGRRIEDAVREAALDATAQRMAQGEGLRFMQSLVKSNLLNLGMDAIVDKNGRPMSITNYAKMVARTTPREAVNVGKVQQMESMKKDLVKIDTTNTTCPICAIYQGRVYSISGKDKRFPWLKKVAGFRSGYHTIHPNCTHVLMPYIERFDADVDQTIKNSNRAFKLTKSDEDMVDRYYAEQKVKALRRKDLKEYEKLMRYDNELKEFYAGQNREFVSKMPKTFSAYRSIKKANGERFAEIRIEQTLIKKYESLTKAEPDISKLILEMRDKLGMEVGGFEFRVKTFGSFRDKMLGRGLDYDLKDAIRYTYIDEPEKLAESCLKSIETFEKNGYDVFSVRNTWYDKSNPYNGINTNIKTADGVVFELQYHTQESLDIKNGKMHDLYKEQSLLKTPDGKDDVTNPEYIRLANEQFILSNSMQIPKDIEKVENR